MTENWYGLFSVTTGAYQGGIGFFSSLEEAEKAADLSEEEQEESYVGEANWARF